MSAISGRHRVKLRPRLSTCCSKLPRPKARLYLRELTKSLGMIIRSVRLKNIKSYGEGADGEGITVRFQSGINRVAGRNGNGKTTLIEGLGYALFFCDPQFQES